MFDKDTVALRGPDAIPDDIRSFYPVGLHYVIVNGQVAVEGHEYRRVRAGKVLRR